MSPKCMKYQLEHHTVHGRFDGTEEAADKGLLVNGLLITRSSTPDPTVILWGEVGIGYVRESIGAFASAEGCNKHCK